MATLIQANGTMKDVKPSKKAFTLEELQQMVGGDIETLSLRNGKILIVNEEGKLRKLPFNREATNLFWEDRGGSDVIVGDAVLCTLAEMGD